MVLLDWHCLHVDASIGIWYLQHANWYFCITLPLRRGLALWRLALQGLALLGLALRGLARMGLALWGLAFVARCWSG